MNILITGNLGYVGPVVAAHLRDAIPGARLIGFDAGFFAACLLPSQPWPEVVYDTQHFGDVRRIPAEVWRGVEAVVHLAAVSNDPMGEALGAVTDEINAHATIETARCAKAAGARAFVFASSCSVYGAAGRELRDETCLLCPRTAYARSKIAAEHGLASLAEPGFTVSCLRFATACGLSPRLRLDLVLNDFVASALATGRIDLLSDGTPWRPLIHVRDMARAIEWALVRPASAGGAFVVVNVGATGANYQVKTLAEAVRDRIGGVEVRLNPAASPDARSYRVDFGLYARLAPRHLPRESLLASIDDLAIGLRACGFADREFRQSAFVRLHVLTMLQRSGRLTDDLEWPHARARRCVHASTSTT